MGIITIQDIEKIIEKFGESTIEDGDWYFIVNKEFVDGIRGWLDGYTYTDEGQWLGYSLHQSANEEQVYVLRLYVD